MSELTHWKQNFNYKYLGSQDLIADKDMIVRFKTIGMEEVVGEGGKKEDCQVARFYENVKPMILNKTNCKIIEKIYKTPFIEDWIGKKIQLYVDHAVKGKAGEIGDGLRIRNIVPAEPKKIELKCAECKNDIVPFNGGTAEQMHKATLGKYGMALCGECYTKRKVQAETIKTDENGEVKE